MVSNASLALNKGFHETACHCLGQHHHSLPADNGTSAASLFYLGLRHGNCCDFAEVIEASKRYRVRYLLACEKAYQRHVEIDQMLGRKDIRSLCSNYPMSTLESQLERHLSLGPR